MEAHQESTKAASRPTRQRQQLHSAVVQDTTEFASFREEWDELYQSCPSATPFQSWEWLYSWWEVYGEGRYRLRLITLRDAGGFLVGLLPLMVRRRPSLGRLLLLGGDKMTLYSDVMTPYKDVLVREGWEEPVAQAGARALMDMDGWTVADLQELMPQAAAWEIFRKWDGLKTRAPITDYVLIHAKSWEDLLPSLSRNLRSIARRTLRRLTKDEARYEPANMQNAEQAARRLVDLHRELFRGRRIAPGHLTPRYEAFIERAARRMTARRIGRISEFWRADGEVLVSQFLVFDKNFVGSYIIGASEEASRRYQFTTLHIWDAMNVACTKSNAYVSIMNYASWEKLRWASEVVTSQRMILGRSLAFWVPYAGYFVLPARYYALRSKAQAYVHSEDAPRWIHSATQRYYALRGKYGYGWLRYRYELARARREIRWSNDTLRKY